MDRSIIPGWLNVLVLGGTFASVLWLERRPPLRWAVEPQQFYERGNLAAAVLCAAPIRLAEKPLHAAEKSEC